MSSAEAQTLLCGRCDRPITGKFCCGLPNDPKTHEIERKIRALKEALRPQDGPEDEVGDVWVRTKLHYEDEPIEERTYTVGNIGGSESELLLSDGEWYSDFDLIDAGLVRQKRESRE